MSVHISPGNSKMGAIPSVSLPAGTTCRRNCPCFKKCYARRLERFRKAVHESYEENYALLQSDPDTYWREVEAAVMMNRFFRFHVAGDVPDTDYLKHIIEIASRNIHCEILCFTKQYEIVNGLMEEYWEHTKPIRPILPPNLHLIFSAWKGLEMQNPWGFPEAHVIFRDGSTTAREGAKECGGNCTTCAKTKGGCWSLGYGEQLTIHEH